MRVTSPARYFASVRAGSRLSFAAVTGHIAQWTHPTTLAHFGVEEKGAGVRLRKYRMLSAGIVGLQYERRGVREMIQAWAACAHDAFCIAPPGSSRANHRQDQSALSILAARFGYSELIDIRQATSRSTSRVSTSVMMEVMWHAYEIIVLLNFVSLALTVQLQCNVECRVSVRRKTSLT